MADMIVKMNDKDAVEEMSIFLKSLTEEQRRFMFATLEGVKLGIQLAERAASDNGETATVSV